MKKLRLILTLLTFNFSLSALHAQAPQAIPYQAVARDNAGNPIANQAVSLRFTIHDATAGGTIVYQETQSKTTNALGLFTANIGEGTVVSGTFATVNWGAGSKFMQVEMDATGGTTYTDMGTQQMLSVPYALNAGNGNWTKTGNDITNSNIGNVGIGTTTPPAKLTAVGAAGNPSIPGTNSTGAFRIGVSPIEGIDFGKMGDSPYSSWVQSGYDGSIADPLSLQPMGGNVGIGTTTPGAQLEVAGQVKITGGTPGAGKVLTSDATGLATWTTPAATGSHFIGESYGGGIVFYIYDNGLHGLIAATADQNGGVGVRWYAGANTNTMAYGGKLNACYGCFPTAGGIGGGRRNTDLIIASQGFGDGATYAARVCNEYSVTVAGVTYEDWYLPSIDELHLLYLQKTAVGGFPSDVYWSSTEANYDGAWYEYFGSGVQANASKPATARVHAVRAF